MAQAPLFIDLGKRSRKDIKRLKRGEGKLAAKVDRKLGAQRAEGDDRVVVVVERKLDGRKVKKLVRALAPAAGLLGLRRVARPRPLLRRARFMAARRRAAALVRRAILRRVLRRMR